MPELPIHPAVVHFPVAGAFFAAGALAIGLCPARSTISSELRHEQQQPVD